MDILLNTLRQHIDTIIQTLGTLLAAFIPHSLKKRKNTRRAERRQRKEDRARRVKAENQLKHYIHNLLHDPHITQIHIVGMSHPLKLEKVYVPLLIHPESSLKYSLDPGLREAEETCDPNVLLQAAQQSLEQHIDGAIDPDEAIRRFKQCVIVGNPGAGKTTLLRYLAIKSAKNELPGLPSLPIYVQLNTFNPSVHHNLLDLIMAQVDSRIPTSDQHVHDLLNEMMLAGQILLLLDGLDETKIGISDEHAESAYVAMVEAIKKLASMIPQLPIVVTVRRAGYQYRPKVQGFHELEMVDFQPEDSKTFITNWFNATLATSKEEKIKHLTLCLERNLRIQSLVSNPLLLSLAVIVYEGHLELPERRADFYRQCVELLQSKWDVSRDIKRRREFPLIFQSQLLQEVAWHFHMQGKHYFPIDELLQVIGKFLPTVDISEGKSRDVLEQIDMENGLLREQAKGWYGFSHLTFQEYFVTQYIIANHRQDDLLQHLNNPWWEEVLLLYVGTINDAGPLLNILLGHDETTPLQDDEFHSHLILAGQCLTEKPHILHRPLRDEVINQLFEILHTTPYSLTREQAANTLAMIGGPRVNSRLLGILSSSDEKLLDIRESVGWALGSYGERSLALTLADQISQKQTGRYIRIIIARVLGTLGERGITNTLLHLLSDEKEDIYVRQSIALTLGMLGDSEMATSLVQLLDNTTENPLVQQSIVVALGILEDSCAASKLQDILANEQVDWHVRGSAAKTLGILGAQQAIPTMLEILANNYDNTYVRGRIAAVLRTFGPEAVCIDCLQDLFVDKALDATVRSSIAQTLGALGEQDVVPSFLQLLSDRHTDLPVRISIAIALGDQGNRNQRTLHVLNELLFDQQLDLNLRGSVAATLGMLGSTTVIDELLKLIEEPGISQDLLLHILHALENLGDHNNVDKREIAARLVEILSSEYIDRYRGQNIAWLLCALGEHTIVPSLLILLTNQDIDRDIRQSIADALAQLAYDEQSVQVLTSLLGTSDIVDDVFRALWAVSRHVKSRKLA